MLFISPLKGSQFRERSIKVYTFGTPKVKDIDFSLFEDIDGFPLRHLPTFKAGAGSPGWSLNLGFKGGVGLCARVHRAVRQQNRSVKRFFILGVLQSKCN